MSELDDSAIEQRGQKSGNGPAEWVFRCREAAEGAGEINLSEAMDEGSRNEVFAFQPLVYHFPWVAVLAVHGVIEPLHLLVGDLSCKPR